MKRRTILKSLLIVPFLPKLLLAQTPQAIEGKVILGYWPPRRPPIFRTTELGGPIFISEIIKLYPKTDYSFNNDLIDVNNFVRAAIKKHPEKKINVIYLLINQKYISSWKKENEKWFIKGDLANRWFPVNLKGEL